MIATSKIRVLLAEDHPTICRELHRIVASDPELEVVGEVGDGETAVALAGQLCPDVVVMDVSLPRLNGFVASRRIGRSFPRTAVVMLADDHNLDYQRAALDHGAGACLAKAAVYRQLVHAIKMVFGGMYQDRVESK